MVCVQLCGRICACVLGLAFGLWSPGCVRREIVMGFNQEGRGGRASGAAPPPRNSVARMTVRASGASMSMSPQGERRSKPPKRGVCKGWSRAVARRNAQFLQSVDVKACGGFSYSLSLTVRDLPSLADWRAARHRFIQGLRRMGMVRMHWLTEWQSRGVPHLHCLVFFSGARDPARVIDCWVSAVGHGASWPGQVVKATWGISGWMKYLAKHGARGVDHYQRSQDTMPDSWKGNCGRMWGALGDWACRSSSVVLSPQLFYKLRRAFFRLANLKSARLSHAASSAVLGGSCWIQEDLLMRLARFYSWEDPDCWYCLEVSS